MPIVYDPKTFRWEIKDATELELSVLMHIGKQMVIEGLAGRFTNEKYEDLLKYAPNYIYHSDV